MNHREWELKTNTQERPPERPAPDVRHGPLEDPRLRAPQMATVRASLARSLQAQIGNRALGAMLMREPTAQAPPAVEHQTGEAVDDALSACEYFANLVEARFLAGVKADGHVVLEPPPVFEEAYVKMATAKVNPKTGKHFSEAAARTLAKNAAAFEDAGEIHVNEAFGDAGTVVHESMHLYSGEFLANTCRSVSEGTTEYFTKTLCAEMRIARGEHYVQELTRVQRLVALLGGEEPLAAAYFQDKLPELQAAVDSKTAPDTFRQWLVAMSEGEYDDADALI
jgi:hypothetical protein